VLKSENSVGLFFFGYHCFVHHEFDPQARLLISSYCLVVLRGMWYEESSWKWGLQEHGISITIMHHLSQHC
jgi:hypothetical protein